MMGGVSASHLMGLSQKGKGFVPHPPAQVGFCIWGHAGMMGGGWGRK